jgi:guanylate kinase
MVEPLPPSKCKAQSSNSSTTRKKRSHKGNKYYEKFNVNKFEDLWELDTFLRNIFLPD